MDQYLPLAKTHFCTLILVAFSSSNRQTMRPEERLHTAGRFTSKFWVLREQALWHWCPNPCCSFQGSHVESCQRLGFAIEHWTKSIHTLCETISLAGSQTAEIALHCTKSEPNRTRLVEVCWVRWQVSSAAPSEVNGLGIYGNTQWHTSPSRSNWVATNSRNLKYWFVWLCTAQYAAYSNSNGFS